MAFFNFAIHILHNLRRSLPDWYGGYSKWQLLLESSKVLVVSVKVSWRILDSFGLLLSCTVLGIEMSRVGSSVPNSQTTSFTSVPFGYKNFTKCRRDVRNYKVIETIKVIVVFVTMFWKVQIF